MILILAIDSTVIIPLYIENELFSIGSLILLTIVTTLTLLSVIILNKMIWSKRRNGEVSVRRNWIFLKVFRGWNYVELLPRKVEKLNDISIKVTGDPWRFKSQSFVLQFESLDDASRIFNEIKGSLP